MDGYRNWGIFTCDMEKKDLEDLLWRLWGVECPRLPERISIEELYEKTKKACLAVGGHLDKTWVTDEDYIWWLYDDQTNKPKSITLKDDAYKLDYLVLHTLFQIQKEELDPDDARFRSLADFLNNDYDWKDTSFYSKLLTKYYVQDDGPCFLKLFGIDRNSERGNYRISKFLEKLTRDSLKTIKSNPYTKDCNGVQVKKFFKKHYLPFVEEYGSPSEEVTESIDEQVYGKSEIDSLLTYYALERIYDVGSMTYLVENRESMAVIFQFLLDLALPLYFVPNPQGKSIYLDLWTKVLSPKNHNVVFTRFDWWETGEEVFGSSMPKYTGAEVAAQNLKKAQEYFKYLAQVYYPVLTAAFYVAFRYSYQDMNEGKTALVRYAKSRNLLNQYKQRMAAQCAAISYFEPKEWVKAAEYYAMIKREVWQSEENAQRWMSKTSVDYQNAGELYLNQILKALIREKVECKRYYELRD